MPDFIPRVEADLIVWFADHAVGVTTPGANVGRAPGDLPQAPAGARLLAEYFSFPERFCAFAIDGIGAALRACGGQPLDITILLGERREPLARVVDAQRLALHTVPVVNLFPRRCERVPLDGVAEAWRRQGEGPRTKFVVCP